MIDILSEGKNRKFVAESTKSHGSTAPSRRKILLSLSYMRQLQFQFQSSFSKIFDNAKSATKGTVLLQ